MTTASDVATALDLERFFSHEGSRHDLLAGTVRNPAGGRVIFLSADVVRGIHQALVNETGPAWTLILKNCGVLWGRRVAAHLERELRLLFNAAPGELPVPEFVRLVEGYFSAHGWGCLRLDLSEAASSGLVLATLENSLFADTLQEQTCKVDYLVAGMLRSLFAEVSGQELDCQELESVRTGSTCGLFVITGASRLDALDGRIEQGEPGAAILESLRSRA
jgi:predicted hydrocarbon binding protein